MGQGNQGWEQARPLDVLQQWKIARLQSSFTVFPGFSCQLLEEDDEDEARPEGEPPREQPEQPTLFRSSTDVNGR